MCEGPIMMTSGGPPRFLVQQARSVRGGSCGVEVKIGGSLGEDNSDSAIDDAGAWALSNVENETFPCLGLHGAGVRSWTQRVETC